MRAQKASVFVEIAVEERLVDFYAVFFCAFFTNFCGRLCAEPNKTGANL